MQTSELENGYCARWTEIQMIFFLQFVVGLNNNIIYVQILMCMCMYTYCTCDKNKNICNYKPILIWMDLCIWMRHNIHKQYKYYLTGCCTIVSSFLFFDGKLWSEICLMLMLMMMVFNKQIATCLLSCCLHLFFLQVFGTISYVFVYFSSFTVRRSNGGHSPVYFKLVHMGYWNLITTCHLFVLI